MLASAPGLGWSNPDHPGHTLFPLFAMLLSRGTIGDALIEEMNATGCEPLDTMFETDEGHRPRLATPSVVAVVQHARSGLVLSDADGDAAIDAMRVAAQKRVEGILGHSRRRHYGHAALLVASCLAFVPTRREAEFYDMGRGSPTAVLPPFRVGGNRAGACEARIDLKRAWCAHVPAGGSGPAGFALTSGGPAPSRAHSWAQSRSSNNQRRQGPRGRNRRGSAISARNCAQTVPTPITRNGRNHWGFGDCGALKNRRLDS